MAQVNITASEFNVARQRIQDKYIKIELLNSDFQVVDSLEGVAMNGSINIDANSDIRRTATLKFVITDSSFEVNPGGKIWLSNYIALYLGTLSLAENSIIYSKIGVFVIDAPSYEYDATNNSIELTLLDLMSKLTGLRNGYLEGIPVLIPNGTNIRQAIISLLALGGFTRYVCEEAPSPSVVPNDLTFSQGSTIYSILSALRDIYPSYEMYFDADGVFHYSHIPTGANEPIQVDDSLWKEIVLSEKVDVDFQNIKNYIEVYGRTHDPAYFSSSTTQVGNDITLTIQGMGAYEDGVVYGFTLTNPATFTNIRIRINSDAYLNVLDDDGGNATIYAQTGEIYYCIQYVANSGGTPYWRWLGHLQAFAIAQDTNPNSPYNVNGTLGVIRLPLFGEDYDNCITDYLAQQRASYELYMRTNMQNTLTISAVAVPWLDVNMLVQYTLQRNNETALYITKTISYGFDIDDMMQITMMKYYPS